MSTLREHVVLSVAFVLTRAALYAAGVHLNFDIDWMFLADPVDLRDRLLETVFYFHAFPPGMNLLTGLILKLSVANAAWLAAGIWKFSSLALINSLLYLCRSSGLSSRVSLASCLAFALIPQAIYFENLYLYTAPTAALVCTACALFHRASRRGSFGTWLAFFAVCSALGWLRSTFHLTWFVAMVLLAVLFDRQRARTIVLAALGPGLLLSALYLKNLTLFGTFGSSTWLGANLTQVTVAQMPAELRHSWVEQGKLSPFSELSVFTRTRAYLEFFPASDTETGPAALTTIERPSTGVPNYNHRLFLEVNRRRQQDALAYLREFPFEYLATVIDNVGRMFGPTTDWHPIKDSRNPHHEQRKVLGGYEMLYNDLVHSLFMTPIGLYWLFPLPIALALWRAQKQARSPLNEVAARGRLALFCGVQVVYVVLLSSLTTRNEASRYRYQIEALLWLLVVLGVVAWLEGRRTRPRGRRSMAAQAGP